MELMWVVVIVVVGSGVDVGCGLSLLQCFHPCIPNLRHEEEQLTWHKEGKGERLEGEDEYIEHR